MHSNIDELVRLFQLAGATDPTGWARSEAEENVAQLARFLFLRQAWKLVIPAGDLAWIDKEIDYSRKRLGAPGTGLGVALERLVNSGASPADISEVARCVQWQVLHYFCYLLSDPDIEEPELKHIQWGLFEVDGAGNPGRPVELLHESVLETDPTGREMRPKTGI
jgi:hypothetical protein